MDSTIDNNQWDKGYGVGGIENASGTVTVMDSTIDNNSGSLGIFNSGSMTVTNSTIDDNQIVNNGTMTLTDSTIDDSSGGINNAGTMTLTDSTIANNSVYAIANYGPMTVTDSTIDDNSAYEGEGAIYNYDAMTVTDSTIDDNSGGGISNHGPMTVTQSTIAYNSGDVFGGIFNSDFITFADSTIADNSGGGIDSVEGTITLDNTIVALNTGSDIAGTVSSSSAYNLIGTGGSGGLVDGVNGNQVGVADPGLGTLADNGGPTQTIALLPGSPAIDKGSNALAVDPITGQPLTTDQRGIGFSRIVNNTVNIGAFEFQPTPTAAARLSLTVQPPGTLLTGGAFGLIVSVEDSSGVVTPSFDGTVTVALLSNPGGATLGGTLTVTAQDGVATFSGLTLDQVSNGYTLRLTSTGLAAATTDVIDVQTNTAPTHYTVDMTGDTGAGSGSSGDLRYVIAQADADTNPLGRVIQFDPAVFSSPQTIVLNSTLPDLSNATGLTDIEGPGAAELTVARSSGADHA